MIWSLNQLNFQKFGVVLSGWPQNETDQNPVSVTGPGQDCLLETQGQVCLRSRGGNPVLSVFDGTESCCRFYLDRPVRLKEKTVFSLSSVEKAAVEIAGVTAPLNLGQKDGLEPRKNGFRMGKIVAFRYGQPEKGYFFPGETHLEAELIYVNHGELNWGVEGQNFLLRQGDLILTGPGQWHMGYTDVEQTAGFLSVVFEIETGSLEPLLNRKISMKDCELLQRMIREHPDPYAEQMVKCLLTPLLISLLREWEPENPSPVFGENRTICCAQQYIAGHVQQPLTVPDVAEHVHRSASYLTALFRKNLQLSPGEYIRRAKLQRSRQMIREGNLNFTEIAQALQYSTVHHFSRQFKEKFGITPTEYARRFVRDS